MRHNTCPCTTWGKKRPWLVQNPQPSHLSGVRLFPFSFTSRSSSEESTGEVVLASRSSCSCWARYWAGFCLASLAQWRSSRCSRGKLACENVTRVRGWTEWEDEPEGFPRPVSLLLSSAASSTVTQLQTCISTCMPQVQRQPQLAVLGQAVPALSQMGGLDVCHLTLPLLSPPSLMDNTGSGT